MTNEEREQLVSKLKGFAKETKNPHVEIALVTLAFTVEMGKEDIFGMICATFGAKLAGDLMRNAGSNVLNKKHLN